MDIVAFFRKSAIKKETEKVQDNVTACCSSEKTADATEKKDCKPENKMKRKQDENYDQNYDKKKKEFVSFSAAGSKNSLGWR